MGILNYLTFPEYFGLAYVLTLAVLLRIPSKLPLGRNFRASAAIALLGFVIWPIAFLYMILVTLTPRR